jgi:hypothetical protein
MNLDDEPEWTAALETCRETLNAAERAAGVYGTPVSILNYIEQAEATLAEQAQQIARLRHALRRADGYFHRASSGPYASLSADAHATWTAVRAALAPSPRA